MIPLRAHIRHLLWAGVATAVVCAILIQWVDIPLARFFENYKQTWWSMFFAAITDFASGYIWYPVGVLGIIAAYTRHKWRGSNPARLIQEKRAWLFMIVTMASTGAAINILKVVIGRERPRLLFRDGTSGFHPFNLNLSDCGFPSGHTQAIWAAMLCLCIIYPPLRWIALIAAVLVSASRIVITAHFAGDVTAGMYIAVVGVVLWRYWFERKGISLTLRA